MNEIIKKANNIKIEKVWIKKTFDDNPDTSFLGEHTDQKSDWVICRHCGEFVFLAEEPNRKIKELEETIDSFFDDDEFDFTPYASYQFLYLEELENELKTLDPHDCPKSSREYNYFKPYACGEDEGTEDFITYGKQGFKRMEGLNNSDWFFMGITAKAKIRLPNDTVQVIESGGLWGIESDSDNGYLQTIIDEELHNLRESLEALGIGKRAITYAFKDVEVKEAF
jgi:hypothetical protein